jgi:hypothetical protein
MYDFIHCAPATCRKLLIQSFPWKRAQTMQYDCDHQYIKEYTQPQILGLILQRIAARHNQTATVTPPSEN